LDGAADDRAPDMAFPAHEQYLVLAVAASVTLLLMSLFMAGSPARAAPENARTDHAALDRIVIVARPAVPAPGR